MANFKISLVPLEEREQEFSKVLAATLDPLVIAVQKSVQKNVETSDASVFLLNCYYVIMVTIAPSLILPA